MPQKEQDEHEYVGDEVKELAYNPRYEDMWTPKCGPDNPNVTEFHKKPKNTITGYVEKAVVNEFHFDNQRKTFHSYGYALDPSSNTVGDTVVGKLDAANEANSTYTKITS